MIPCPNCENIESVAYEGVLGRVSRIKRLFLRFGKMANIRNLYQWFYPWHHCVDPIEIGGNVAITLTGSRVETNGNDLEFVYGPPRGVGYEIPGRYIIRFCPDCKRVTGFLLRE